MVERIDIQPIAPAQISPYAGGGPLFDCICGTTTNPDHQWAVVYNKEIHRLVLLVDGEYGPAVDTLFDCLDAVAHLDDPHWPPPRRDYTDSPLSPEEEAEREHPLGKPHNEKHSVAKKNKPE